MPPSDLIDDFEKDSSPRNEFWQIYKDGSTETQFDCFHDQENLRMDFTIPAEDWATCTLFFPEVRDWNQYEGIAFMVRGDIPAQFFNIIVHGGALGASTSYHYNINIGPDDGENWITVNVPWDQIKGSDSDKGTLYSIDLTAITGISFGFNNPSANTISGTLWVDDLKLKNEIELIPTPSQTPTPEPRKSTPTPTFLPTLVTAPITPELDSQDPPRPCPGSTTYIGILLVGVMTLVIRKRF